MRRDLESLDEELKAVSGTDPGRPFFGSHPVFQYLSHRYGMKIEYVHWEPGEVPDSNELRTLRARMARHPAKWMIWEGKPASDAVRKLRKEGLESLVFDPCANRPAFGDFIEAMKTNIENLAQAYSKWEREPE